MKEKSYYVLFTLKGKSVCGCWRRGKDKEEAMLNAEFALMCHYPYVEYDDCCITDIRD